MSNIRGVMKALAASGLVLVGISSCVVLNALERGRLGEAVGWGSVAVVIVMLAWGPIKSVALQWARLAWRALVAVLRGYVMLVRLCVLGLARFFFIVRLHHASAWLARLSSRIGRKTGTPPWAYAYWLQATSHWFSGEPERARRVCVTWADVLPSGLPALGFMSLQMGRLSEAQDCFDRALADPASRADALMGKAAVTYAEGNAEAAGEYAQRAVEAGFTDVRFLEDAPYVKQFCDDPRYMACSKEPRNRAKGASLRRWMRPAANSTRRRFRPGDSGGVTPSSSLCSSSRAYSCLSGSPGWRSCGRYQRWRRNDKARLRRTRPPVQGEGAVYYDCDEAGRMQWIGCGGATPL